MNREQWQTKRGQHADALLPVAARPLQLDRNGIPVPANDMVMRRPDVDGCCEWSLMPSTEPAPRR